MELWIIIRVLHFWFIKIHFYALSLAGIWTFHLACTKWIPSKHVVFISWDIRRHIIVSIFSPTEYILRRFISYSSSCSLFCFALQVRAHKIWISSSKCLWITCYFPVSCLLFQMNNLRFYLELCSVCYSIPVLLLSVS